MTTRREFFGLLAGGVLVPMSGQAQERAKEAALADRAELVASEKLMRFSGLPDGTLVDAGGSRYRRVKGASEIPDLPNWLPDGDVSVLHFGAVGDCSGEGVGQDDGVPIQRALNWWMAANYRKLIFPAGLRYRLGAPVRAHLDGKIGRVGNTLIMEGPITPDPGIGTALSLKGFRHGHFRVRGYQGGQDADYRQEAPKGGDTLLRINATRRCKVDVEAVDYLGRAVFVDRGMHPYKQSYIDLTVSTGDIATLPGARPVGQMIYARGTSAWGSMSGNGAWETYGSVFDSVVDLRVDVLELGTKTPDAPVQFLGCGSVWIDSLLTGDETHEADLLHFVPNNAGAGCRRIHIGRCFAVGPKRAIVVRDTDPKEYGIRIDHLETRQCSGPALVLDGVTGADINHSSQEDAHSVVVRGRSSNIRLNLDSYNAASESLVIEAEAENVTVTGLSHGAGRAAAGKVAVVRVETIRPVFFEGFQTRGDSVTASFDLVAENNVSILGGRYEAGKFKDDVLAKQIRNARGLKTEVNGTFIIPKGESEVRLTHGLLGAPYEVVVSVLKPKPQTIYAKEITDLEIVFSLKEVASIDMVGGFRANMIQALGQ